MKRNFGILLTMFLMTLLTRFILQSITIKVFIDKSSVIEEKAVKKDSVIVTATMYYAVVGQCDSDPLVTASMRKINPKKASEHRWIALSRNLLKRWGGRFDYGDKVKLVGTGVKDGVYTIVDCMNARFVNKIDILETQGTKPYKFDNVKIVEI
jgi:3D (Asp-Asp-Asp) domain-containing protein